MSYENHDERNVWSGSPRQPQPGAGPCEHTATAGTLDWWWRGDYDLRTHQQRPRAVREPGHGARQQRHGQDDDAGHPQQVALVGADPWHLHMQGAGGARGGGGGSHGVHVDNGVMGWGMWG